MNAPSTAELDLFARVQLARRVSRWALGLVWVYEGLVPKILFGARHPEQTALVAQSALMVHSAEATLAGLGIVQTLLGLVLLTGWKDRWAALMATLFMALLMVLVALGRPGMLTDPFGALVKDLCLAACAAVVWVLPARPRT
jgi:uncharacterized membrane protein YphA (DoxX/SURF4 family)